MPEATEPSPTNVPQISHADLLAFHEAHFAQDGLTSFTTTYLKPGAEAAAEATEATANDEEYYDEEDYDDGLGYYPDGVKRTLTDEQIEIFRHSELEQLRKAQEKKSEKQVDAGDSEGSNTNAPTVPKAGGSQLEGPNRKKRKTKRSPAEPKPDLRKRTWDVVEAGLDTLDYD